jgi:nucleoid-associated protein YgaU
VVDALLAANRDRLRDKDRVVVGTKLVLPDLPSAGDMPRSTAVSIRPSPSLVAVTPEPAPAKPAASKKKAKSAQNSYELQRGDTYSTVAAKVLGTSKRWAEIEKLNKDIFPNAARIRPGVRIRLPRSTADDSDSRARPAR